MAITLESLPPSRAAGSRIGDLVTTTLSVSPQASISDVVRLFEAHPELDGMAVVGASPRYLSRPRFFLQLGRRFGYALFEHRPVSMLAEDGSVVEFDADPVEVISLATQREPARVFDDIIVVQGKRYLGLVSMRALLAHHKELLVAGIAERGLLEEKNRQLEELHRIQSEFMANMTHELRSPLNTMLGVAQILRADAELGARHHRNLDLLMARGKDLLAIVDNILDLARLESGGMAPLLEPVDLEALLDDLAASTELALASKPVRLQVSFRSLPAGFTSDPVFLRRILTNLLSNAVKFTDVGSITLAAEGGATTLTLRVCDTGVGIKEADRERLFSRFGQLETTRTKRHAGTGLGLAIVKGLVDQLGGTIAVDSQEGAGTRITLQLPDVRRR